MPPRLDPRRRRATAGTRPAAPAPLEHRMLLTATMCLLAFGAVMVYSASSARNLLEGGGDGSTFLVRYVGFGLIGLLGMRLLSRADLEAVRRLTPMVLVGSIGLLLLVLVPGIGVTINGATRWIAVGPVQFQPSELAKIALVLWAASYLASNPRRIRTLSGAVSPVLVVAALLGGLVIFQPDLGTALVMLAAAATLLICAGVQLRHLGAIAFVGVLAIALIALAEPYRRARVTSFLNPWDDAGGAGFQAVQGQIALGSGGLFGVGLGESVQKVFYLPEAHTDFILAVIGEELGLMGIFGVLALYGMVLWSGLRIARRAPGGYAKLLAAGLTALILCQAILNIFVVLGLAPLTGVPLPLISYGQTNVCVILAAIGLLLNISSGGAAKLRSVPTGRERAGPDRGRRDGRARGAGARGGRRAAG